MNTNVRYTVTSAIATLLALIVVMLGAYTRLGDAGLGCPDWPGCYGHLTVPQTPQEMTAAQHTYQQTVEPTKAWKEMIHRYFAGALGVLILILALWAFKRKLRYANQPIVTPVLLLLLVIFQAMLGMWTVTWLVLPLIVSAHLLGGMMIAALLWYLTLASRTGQPTIPKGTNRYRFWAILGLLIVSGQIFLGAWTSTNYAALICPNFPLCQGSFFPILDFHKAFDLFHPIGINYEGGVLDTTARVTIQMTHRYGALLTLIFIGGLSLTLITSKYAQSLRSLGWWLCIVLLIQFALGIANVIWMVPMQVAVAHNGVAALLLLVMVTLVYKLYRKHPDKRFL